MEDEYFVNIRRPVFAGGDMSGLAAMALVIARRPVGGPRPDNVTLIRKKRR
jgi:hypothetical protein